MDPFDAMEGVIGLSSPKKKHRNKNGMIGDATHKIQGIEKFEYESGYDD